MTKENFLFVIIGLLGGFMIGFIFANSVNQSETNAQPIAQQNGEMPAGHPAIGGATGGGSIPEVTAALEKARQNPDDFDAQMKAAELYYQIQRFEGSIEFLKRASELQPENHEVTINLANAYFDAGRYEDAEKSYTKVLAEKPDDLNVRTDLGLTFVFREKPDHDRAIQEFTKVLASDPSHLLALQNLTVAYTKKSDRANAVETLARLEKVDSTNAAITKLREEITKLENK